MKAKHLTISIDHNSGSVIITPSDKFNGTELRSIRINAVNGVWVRSYFKWNIFKIIHFSLDTDS